MIFIFIHRVDEARQDNELSEDEDRLVNLDDIPDIHSIDKSLSKKRKLEMEARLESSKRRQIVEEVYNSAMWVRPRKHVDDRVRKIVRESIFSKTKFFKGEGVAIIRTKEGRRRHELRKITYGKSHDRFDITGAGYALEVMKQCDITADNFTLEERSLWWKVYNRPVKDELMSMRGRKGYHTKELVQNSKEHDIV